MISTNLKILIILIGIFVVACSGGGSGSGPGNNGSDGQTTAEDHSEKSQVNYLDNTTEDPDDSGVAGPMKLKRVISMAMDFANSDGLTSFNRDMSLKYGSELTVNFKTTQTQECATGGSISIGSKLFKELNYQQADEKEEEVQTLSNGDSFVLDQSTYYFIRAYVTVSGPCTAFKSTIQAEIHY